MQFPQGTIGQGRWIPAFNPERSEGPLRACMLSRGMGFHIFHEILLVSERFFIPFHHILPLFLTVDFAFVFGFDFLSLALIFLLLSSASCFPPLPPFLCVEGLGLAFAFAFDFAKY